MSYGVELGNLRSTSTGLSFVGSFDYTGGNSSIYYIAEAFEFATGAEAIVLPQVNIPANYIPQFPTVSVSVSNANKRVSVTANGGNVSSKILVFVK